jgi:nucleolar protein 4
VVLLQHLIINGDFSFWNLVYLIVATSEDALKTRETLDRISLDKIRISASVLGDGKRSRLIIRNLSFRCPEKHLRNVFSKCGEIVDFRRPSSDGKTSAFAFVQFAHAHQAQKAIDTLNSTKIDGRAIAVDWALPKDKYVKHMIKHQESAPSSSKSDSDDDQYSDQDDSQEEKDEHSEQSENNSSDSEDNSDESQQQDSSSDSADEDSEQEEKNVGSADVHLGLTLFLRNLSFDSTEDAIQEKFQTWGEVDYGSVVRDFQTGRSRGTGFVKFKSREELEACLREAYPDCKDFSVLPDRESSIQLDGRNLIISLAVDRSSANKLAEQKKLTPKQPADKRNLYLAYEGVITEQDDASKHISKADLAKRKRALVEKKIKLRNPNFFVSKTRLSVRNIPRHLDEADLKALFKKHSSRDAVIRQAKIVREKDRFDSEGKPRSKGYGFIEFTEHEPALAALRALNNHPSVWNKNSRPIVEFAVENVLALQKLSLTKQKGKQPKPTVDSTSNLTKRTRPVSENPQPRKKQKLQNDGNSPRGEKPAKKKPEKQPVKPDKKSPQQKPQPVSAPASSFKKSQPLKKFPGDVRVVKPKSKAPVDKFDNIVADYKRKILQMANDSTKLNKKKWYE